MSKSPESRRGIGNRLRVLAAVAITVGPAALGVLNTSGNESELLAAAKENAAEQIGQDVDALTADGDLSRDDSLDLVGDISEFVPYLQYEEGKTPAEQNAPVTELIVEAIGDVQGAITPNALADAAASGALGVLEDALTASRGGSGADATIERADEARRKIQDNPSSSVSDRFEASKFESALRTIRP